jgi:hypothetical protein
MIHLQTAWSGGAKVKGRRNQGEQVDPLNTYVTRQKIKTHLHKLWPRIGEEHGEHMRIQLITTDITKFR